MEVAVLRPKTCIMAMALVLMVAVGCSTATELPISPTAFEDPGNEPSDVWHPEPGTTWQWQLSGPFDQSVEAAVYDIDVFDTDALVVAALHALGRRVICYVSAGTWEDWRPDADAFPPEVLGGTNGWEGERRLDIRRLDILAPIMSARLDLCRDKGFDGVEPDNIDGYATDSGFPLTYDDQLAYNRWFALEAHQRGLAVALKNDLEQVPDLVDDFDFAINESCLVFDECDSLEPFVAAGKAVLHVEYEPSGCPPQRPGFSSLLKRSELDAYIAPC